MQGESSPLLRVLIVDHYDSYTNNLLSLLQVPGSNDECPGSLAWQPVIIRYDQYKWEDFKATVLPFFDAVILSPGPGRPDHEADFGFNSQLVREADVPILGICLGHQGIGTSFGAKIIHAPHIKHGQVSQIQHDGSGLFKLLPQSFAGVRYNSLVLDPDSLPPDLTATAWTHDLEQEDQKVLMGVRHRNKPIFGVQWHPESVCSSYGLEIINNFKSVVQEFWGSKRSSETRCGARSQDSDAFSAFLTELEPRKDMPALNENQTRRNPPSLHENPAYFVKVANIGAGPPPEVVFDTLIKESTKDGEAWLDSAKSRDQYSRYSYLTSGTFSLSYSTREQNVTVFKDGNQLKCQHIEISFWDWFNDFQVGIQRNVRSLDSKQMVENDMQEKPTLQLGFIGHFGYELKRESLAGYRWARKEPNQENDTQDAQFLFSRNVLQYDHVNRTWKLFGLVCYGSADPIASSIGSKSSIGLTESQFNDYVSHVRTAFVSQQSILTNAVMLPRFTSKDSSSVYTNSISLARSAIKEGDSYEMTLTTTFAAKLGNKDPFALYLALRAKNPAPYSAYINFPATHTSLLSSSPERFISINQDGIAEMKPIKGTVARSKDPQEDALRQDRLATDVKELAENLMIVDLIRSDLHNVCTATSIQVPRLMQIESYETVHQLVTTIQSHIVPSVGSVQAIKSVFPPGSMTGAPKLRSVQILEELEQGIERGVYSGCLGYICVSGAADQSVVIRTIVRKDHDLELGAGGAITWLSDPDKEWEEVLVKANAVADVRVAQTRANSIGPAREI